MPCTLLTGSQGEEPTRFLATWREEVASAAVPSLSGPFPSARVSHQDGSPNSLAPRVFLKTAVGELDTRPDPVGLLHREAWGQQGLW